MPGTLSFHRDLKFEIQQPYKGDRSFYQQLIDEWRNEYNHIRPHEALGYETPASLYKPSEISYDGDIEELIYPPGFERRKVIRSGAIIFNKIHLPISMLYEGIT